MYIFVICFSICYARSVRLYRLRVNLYSLKLNVLKSTDSMHAFASLFHFLVIIKLNIMIYIQTYIYIYIYIYVCVTRYNSEEK